MNKPILLVEDDQNDVFFMRQALKKSGVTVPLQVATDGQQAIDYLSGAGAFANREEFPLPQLVLLDLKLPYIMGLDILKWIRNNPVLKFPILVLTSSRNEADITQAYHLGANAYLVKPNANADLVELVRSISAFWLTHNTPAPISTIASQLSNPTSLDK